MVNLIPIKRKTNQLDDETRRSHTFEYYLKSNETEKLPVCKKMFLGTPSVKDNMVQNWIKNTYSNGLRRKNNLENTGNTGTTSHSINRSSLETRQKYISDWFNSLPKMPSHYCRKQTSRLYLEGPFKNTQEIYNAYKSKSISDNLLPLSKTFFHQFMKEKKFSIYSPRKDLCDLCCSYKAGNITEEDYALHIAMKNRAREEKEYDKTRAIENQCYTFCMDLRAVQMCPVLQASALYYNMKLKIHNMTIYNMANGDCANYVWNESEGELEASVFVTILIKHLIKVCINKLPIVIYSDGCGYQNCNAVLDNALLHFSKAHNVQIEQKFLVKGHTQMECDSVHSLIERQSKGEDIFLPYDFVKIIKKSHKNPKPLDVELLTYKYFLDFKDYQIYRSIHPGNSKGDPEVKDVRAFKYNPNSLVIEFKLLFDDIYCALPQRVKSLHPEININSYKPLYLKPIDLTLSKWEDLQKLKSVMPVDVHPFYNNLPHKKPFKTRDSKV